MIYITSDYHHDHKNVITSYGRPTTIEDHEEWLIERTNSYVQENDIVYHLGDFSFSKNEDKIRNFCNRLNGTWNHVLGNHDRIDLLEKSFSGTKHKILGNYYELKYDKVFIVMSHYPIESWNRMRHGSYHLCGHMHSHEHFLKLRNIKNRKLVCFDSNKFKPYKLDELIKKED